jgi:hypothetical protein
LATLLFGLQFFGGNRVQDATREAARFDGHQRSVRARLSQTKIKPGQAMHLVLDVKVKPDYVAEVALELTKFRSAPRAYYAALLGHADPGVFFGLSYLAHDLHAEIAVELKEDVLFVHVELPLRSGAEES